MEKDPSIKTRDDYLRALRQRHRFLRMAGTALIVAGVIEMLLSAYGRLGGVSTAPGVVLVALGWMVYAIVIVQRSRWARINRIAKSEE